MASATGRFEVASGSEDAYHEREAIRSSRRPPLAVKREAYRRATFGARVAGYVVTRINRSRRRGRGSKGNTAQPVGTPST